MTKNEVAQIKNIFYTTLVIMLTLSFITLSVYITNKIKIEERRNQNLIQIAVDLLEQKRKLILNEFITQNFDSTEFRIKSTLNRIFEKNFSVFIVKSNQCIQTKKIKQCQKYLSYIDKKTSITNYQKINSLHFIVMPINAFNSSFGHVIINLQHFSIKYHFSEIITLILIPFALLIGVWIIIFKRSEQKIIIPLLESIVENRKNREVALIAEKLAHDIRSPLEALTFISQENSLNSEEKELLTFATNRISDIASEMLDKKRVKQEKNNDSNHLLKNIEKIIKEKDLLHKINFTINTNKPFHIDTLEEKEFKTISSSVENLINNSIHAVNNNSNPIIDISVFSTSEELKIIINDNGHGIDEKIAKRILTEEGITTKKDGNGIGLFRSKENLDQLGIELELITTSKEGTRFQILYKYT